MQTAAETSLKINLRAPRQQFALRDNMEKVLAVVEKRNIYTYR
jgi:hypothetical protein